MKNITREIKFSFLYRHIKDGDITEEIFDLDDLVSKTPYYTTELCDEDGYKILAIRQYTGLKDKNGKEIFIGDIVKFKSMATKDYQNGYIDEYRWSENGNCQYGLKIYQSKFYNGQNNLERTNIDNPTEIEIIGNIYETPNLLDNK